MTEVAMFGLQLDPAHQAVRPSVERVALDWLDHRRTGNRRGAALGPKGGRLNFYLMSALDDDRAVPDDAIDVLKLTLGHAFQRNVSAVQALKALWRGAVKEPEASWALLEAHGSRLNVRAPLDAFSREFLSADFEDWSAFGHQGGRHPGQFRILVELVAPYATETPADAAHDWEQFAQRLSAYAAHADAAPVDKSPESAPAEAAPPSRQDEILADHALSAEQAARRAGTPAEDVAAWASRERRADRLFGVWSSRERAFVHPDFQFTQKGVHPALPTLLKALRSKVGFNPATTDRGGWARAYWLYQPRAELSKRSLAAGLVTSDDPVTAALTLSLVPDDRPRTPAEVFATDPDAVIALVNALASEETPSND
jgi:hypothetical protein